MVLQSLSFEFFINVLDLNSNDNITIKKNDESNDLDADNGKFGNHITYDNDKNKYFKPSYLITSNNNASSSNRNRYDNRINDDKYKKHNVINAKKQVDYFRTLLLICIIVVIIFLGCLVALSFLQNEIESYDESQGIVNLERKLCGPLYQDNAFNLYCDANAECVERNKFEKVYYKCICNVGFEGDGMDCIKSTDSAEQQPQFIQQYKQKQEQAAELQRQENEQRELEHDDDKTGRIRRNNEISIVKFPNGMTWTNNAFGNKRSRDIREGMKAVDVDMFETSVNEINELKADGHIVICYISAGSIEDYREDYRNNKKAWDEVKGQILRGFHGEHWIDITKLDKVKALMLPRWKLAQSKGCDAIEADNVDCFTNKCIKDKDKEELRPYQVEYNLWQAEMAHELGMAIGLKNAITLIEEISEHYEFAINEACVRYNECHRNEPWFAQNKAVFGCEYEGELSDVCATSSDYNTKTKLNLGEGWINCFEGVRTLPATQYVTYIKGSGQPTLSPTRALQNQNGQPRKPVRLQNSNSKNAKNSLSFNINRGKVDMSFDFNA